MPSILRRGVRAARMVPTMVLRSSSSSPREIRRRAQARRRWPLAGEPIRTSDGRRRDQREGILPGGVLRGRKLAHEAAARASPAMAGGRERHHLHALDS